MDSKDPFSAATKLHYVKIDYHQILGIPVQSTETEIKKAYHKLALKWHPDKGAVQDKDIYEKMFKNVSTAYAALTDPTSKN